MKVAYIGDENRLWILNIVEELSKYCEVHSFTVNAADYKMNGYFKENQKNSKGNRDLGETKLDSFVELTHIQNFYDPIFLSNLIEREFGRPDVIIVTSILLTKALIYLSSKFKCKTIQIILDFPIEDYLYDFQRFLMWEDLFINIKKANAVVVNSFFTKNSLESYGRVSIPDENVIYYPIIIPEDFKDKIYCPTCYNNNPFILSSFRINYKKGLHFVIEALSCLLEKYSYEWKYVIVGRDDGTKELLLKLAKDNKINLEIKENMPEQEKWKLNLEADLIVCPQVSLSMGSLHPLEAIYLGKKPLVGDLPYLRELYDRFAEYYNIYNCCDLGEKMISNFQVKTEKGFKKFIENRYTNKVFANKIFNLIKGLV